MSIPKAPAPGAAAAAAATAAAAAAATAAATATAAAAATAPNQISAIATNPAWRDLSLYEYGINREINNSKDYPRLYFTPYDLNPANAYGKFSLTSAQIPPTYLSFRAEVGNELLVLDKLNREKTILESQKPLDQHAILINISRLHATNDRLESQTQAMLAAYRNELENQTSATGATVEEQLIKLNQFSKSFPAHFNVEMETRIELLNKLIELKIIQNSSSSLSLNSALDKVNNEIDFLKKTITNNFNNKKNEQINYNQILSGAKINYEKIINESIVQINQAVTVKKLNELDKKIERVVHDYPHLEGTATLDGLKRNQVMYLAKTAHADQMLTLFAKNAPGGNINFPKLLADRELHHQNLTQTISRLNNISTISPTSTPLPPENQQKIMEYFELKIEEEIIAVDRADDISEVSGKKIEKSIKELFSHIDQMISLLDPINKARIDEFKNTLRSRALSKKCNLIPVGISTDSQISRTEKKIEAVQSNLETSVNNVSIAHKNNINKIIAQAKNNSLPNALDEAIKEISELTKSRLVWLPSTEKLNLIDAQAVVDLEKEKSIQLQSTARAITTGTMISNSPIPKPQAKTENESLSAAQENLQKLTNESNPNVIAKREREIADEAKVQKNRVGMVVVEEVGWTHSRAMNESEASNKIKALPAQKASVSYGTNSGAQFIGLAKGESHFYQSSLPQKVAPTTNNSSAPSSAITVTLQQSADGSHVTDLTENKENLSDESKEKVAMMQAKLILANYKKGQGWDRIVIREPDAQMSMKIHAALLLLIDDSPAKGIEIVNKNRNVSTPSKNWIPRLGTASRYSTFIEEHLPHTINTSGISQQKEMKAILTEVKKQAMHKTEKGCRKEDDPNYFRALKNKGPSNG